MGFQHKKYHNFWTKQASKNLIKDLNSEGQIEPNEASNVAPMLFFGKKTNKENKIGENVLFLLNFQCVGSI